MAAATKQSAADTATEPVPLSAARNDTRAAVAKRAVEITGSVRLGKRTKELTLRLPPQCVVVIHHADLDAVAARALVACRPLAVINAAPFVTGRYPNRGPSVLLDAHIPLFEVGPQSDGTTPDLFARLRDGETVVLQNGELRTASSRSACTDGGAVCRLEPLTIPLLHSRLEAARVHLDDELSVFAQNTLRYLEKAEERALLLDPIAVPPITTSLAGRPVLVAVRGDGYEDDLRRLLPYLREQKPVVIAVDGAADALLALGVRPHILLGDMDSVSDQTLKACAQSGAEIIVHAYARASQPLMDDAPGLVRVQKLGLKAQSFPVGGTSEDAALLLAYEKGADLIVAVGTHTNLEDFLDKGRGGMASTFLVRLKVGSRLVDARGVSKLYAMRRKKSDVPALLLLVLAALFPLLILGLNTGAGQIAWRSVVVWLRLLFRLH